MDIFLVWRVLNPGSSCVNSGLIAKTLKSVFSPFFDGELDVSLYDLEHASLAAIAIDSPGFSAKRIEKDDQTFAAAPQYPIAATSVLKTHGILTYDGKVLTSLARAFESDTIGQRLLSDLAPPFSLIWTSKIKGTTFIQTDGLGHACLYEYRDQNVWAVTNRPFALLALGIELHPVAEEWAVRSILGWFPDASSGFRNLRYVQPGALLRIGVHGIETSVRDVLPAWLGGGPRRSGDCLELARSSLESLIESARSLLDGPSASLSGGWDSRAIFSLLCATKFRFKAIVRGPEDHPDVVVAKQLAELAGFKLRNKVKSTLPPATAEECRQSIVRALIWQSGGKTSHQHKTFQTSGPFKNVGKVGISGQHGEIGRSHYLQDFRNRLGSDVSPTDDNLLRLLTRRIPSGMHAHVRSRAIDAVRSAIAAADRYGLAGFDRWEFFYLYERTRRWSSGAQATRAGITFAPFLNPGMIKASFAYPVADRTDNPFHRHIITNSMPIWTDVPFASDVAQALPSGAVHRRRFYDTDKYWQDVGAPLLGAVLAHEGFWSEVFDPCSIGDAWMSKPDDLAIIGLLPEAISSAGQLN